MIALLFGWPMPIDRFSNAHGTQAAASCPCGAVDRLRLANGAFTCRDCEAA